MDGIVGKVLIDWDGDICAADVSENYDLVIEDNFVKCRKYLSKGDVKWQ